MPIVVDMSPLVPSHPAYEAIVSRPFTMPAPTPSAVDGRHCTPGTRGSYPWFGGGRQWAPDGTYFIKPPGGPVVRGPGGSTVAPTHQLPAGPRGLPTAGGEIVSNGGLYVVPPGHGGAAAPRRRNWMPWLLAGGAAVAAIAGGA